jgi:hypothetical protein
MERERPATRRHRDFARYTPAAIAQRVKAIERDCDEYDVDKKGNPIIDPPDRCCALCVKSNSRCRRVAMEGYDWCWQHGQACDNDYADYKDLCEGHLAGGPPRIVIIKGTRYKLYEDLILPLRTGKRGEVPLKNKHNAKISMILQKADPKTLRDLILGLNNCFKARVKHNDKCYVSKCAETEAAGSHSHWENKLAGFKWLAEQALELQEKKLPTFEFPQVPLPSVNIADTLASSLKSLTLEEPKHEIVQRTLRYKEFQDRIELPNPTDENKWKAWASWQVWQLNLPDLTFKEQWATWVAAHDPTLSPAEKDEWADWFKKHKLRSPTKQSPKKAV